ncbi:MAG: hypothetical protein R3F22_10045 [Lysobacteraceae bacterium]
MGERMGLLDDLEAEAERRRAAAAAEADQAGERDRIWREVTVPGMEALAAYLKQLGETFSLVEHRPRFAYSLDGYGEVHAEVEPSFRVTNEPRGHQHTIQFEFGANVISEACPSISVSGISRVKAIAGLLQQRGLAGQLDPRYNANREVTEARFQARGKFPMKLEVFAEQQVEGVQFRLQNLDGFGAGQRRFRGDQLNPELFDALGRFLARETLRFGGETLADPVRQKLQDKVARDRELRDWGQRIETQLKDGEARVRASMAGGWFGRLFRR